MTKNMCANLARLKKEREESKREAQKHGNAHSRAGLSGPRFSHPPHLNLGSSRRPWRGR